VRRSQGQTEQSDSEDGLPGDEQTRWRVLIGRSEENQMTGRLWSERTRHPVPQQERQLKMRRGSGKLRMNVGVKLGLATPRLRHLTAVAVHGTAASLLFVRH
jgi:hypothetical protein